MHRHWAPAWAIPTPKTEETPQRLPAPVELMTRDFEAMPFRGDRGEMFMAAPAEPAPPPQQELLIPPPPWAGQVPVAPPPVEEPPPSGQLGVQALEQMKTESGDDGWNPAPPGPAEESVPLVPIEFPQPNWREGEP